MDLALFGKVAMQKLNANDVLCIDCCMHRFDALTSAETIASLCESKASDYGDSQQHFKL